MKRTYNSRHFAAIATTLVAIASFTACDIETSHNGKLDGFWHLEQVDTLATGGSADLSADRKFWAIQAKLINVRDINGGSYLLRFNQTADSLILHTPYSAQGQTEETGGNPPLDDPAPLTPFGINGLREGFAKEKLDGSKMILRSKTLRLKFRKF